MFCVRLATFEGPLDLLLYFIRRDELDLYDIPIARIADEFLAYVRLMEELDLDGVSDFLYMAAVLLEIKARWLLPRPVPVDAELTNTQEDPRQELVDRLLIYLQYKAAAERLASYAEARAHHYTRGQAVAPAEAVSVEPVPLAPVSVSDLAEALEALLARRTAIPVHAVWRDVYSVEAQQRYVIERLREADRWSFRDLTKGHSRGWIIATFLAVLELARLGQLRIEIGEGIEDFSIAAVESDVYAS